LELRSAILFAVLFLAVLVISRLVMTHFGNTGIYGLASVGLIDVDAFILGMTPSAGALTPGSLAANSILIAIASNNVAKGFYAYAFADRRTGLQSLGLLTGLAAVSLIPCCYYAELKVMSKLFGVPVRSDLRPSHWC
jgi:uncharacterized membrane protein (DUF4010 family)